MKTKYLIIFTFLCLVNFTKFLLAQDFVERANSQALLDPKGVALSGAGQDGCACANSFDNYWRTAPEGMKPVLYMDYVDPWHMRPNWSNDLKEKIMRYHRQGYYVIPQIGFKIEHDYKEINAGNMEKELDNFITGFKYLGIPCYVRIGYEFNNIYKKYGGNNRDPEGYVECFQRVAKKIKEANIEVATVWCAGLSGESPVMPDWYPGDEYVDWFGFDPFADIHNGVHAVTIEMCDLATEKSKPILIGESTPMSMNAPPTLDWYQQFYKMVGERPMIKALGYINWDWDIEDMVAGNLGFGWGDARLESFPDIKNYFFEQLKNPGYFHASSEEKFRALLDYDDHTPPPAVTGLKRVGDSLVWHEVLDTSGSTFAHYTIYRDGKFWDYIGFAKYPVVDLGAGNPVEVYIVAVDRAGNPGEKSNTLTVKRVTSIELIENGTFDLPRTTFENDWTCRAANDGYPDNLKIMDKDDFETDSTGKITGPYSAKVTWIRPPAVPAVWKLQLYQEFLVKKDREYEISFKAVAKDSINATLGFMANAIEYKNTHVNHGLDMHFDKEWHKFNMWEIDIGTTVQSYKFKGKADRDDIARLAFMFGTSKTATTVWIDDVSLIYHAENVNINNQRIHPVSGYSLYQNYPNPIVDATKIRYKIPQNAKVLITVHAINGKTLLTLKDQNQAAGTHAIHWDCQELASGIYFYKIKAGPFQHIRKCIIK